VKWAIPVLLAAAIAPPQAGFIRDGAGELRPVHGLAGSFVLGEPVASGVQSAAFSGRTGLAKTRDTLRAFDAEGRLLGETPAAEGPARFAFSSDGWEAVAFLPETCETIRWRNGSFEPASTQDCQAPASPLSADGDELIWRRPEGTEIRTKLAGPPLWIEQMGDGWFHVWESGRHTAVRLRDDRLEIYRLPGSAP
jgi:hypothetical protein